MAIVKVGQTTREKKSVLSADLWSQQTVNNYKDALTSNAPIKGRSADFVMIEDGIPNRSYLTVHRVPVSDLVRYSRRKLRPVDWLRFSQADWTHQATSLSIVAQVQLSGLEWGPSLRKWEVPLPQG